MIVWLKQFSNPGVGLFVPIAIGIEFRSIERSPYYKKHLKLCQEQPIQ